MKLSPLAIMMCFLAVGCASDSVTTETNEQETPVTTPMATTTTSSPYATTPEEAYCAGFLYGLNAFGQEITNEEFNSLFDGYDLPTCMREAPSAIEGWRNAAGEDRDESLENWFVTGCIGPALTYVDEFVEGDPTLDSDLAEAVALETCWTPFDIAADLQVGTEIRGDHVCYYLDFEPTPEQVETGMIRCSD